MMKKLIGKIVNAVSVLVIIASVVVLLSVVLTKSGEAPSVFGFSMFRVMTGSMEPTIRTDSLTIVKKMDPAQIEVGDIISFYSQDPVHGGAVNTHRVAAVEGDDSGRLFVTKGDANQIEDKYMTSEEDVIGKVIFISHPLGVAVHLLSNPLIFIPLIILPLFFILIYNLIYSIKVTKGIVREEEEAAVREAVEAIRKKMAEERKDEDRNESKPE